MHFFQPAASAGKNKVTVTEIILIGFVRSALSILTTGSYIREVTTSNQMTNDSNALEHFNQILHNFVLNKSSKFLVEALSSNEFLMYNSEDELPSNKDGHRIWQIMGSQVDIRINACDFGNNECLQVPTIMVNLVDTGLNSRGFNVALLSAWEGRVIKKQVFDTYEDYTASRRMVNFIDSSADGSIVIIAVQDDGSTRLTQEARAYIAGLGSRYIAKLAFRDKLAIVTAKGVATPPWFAESGNKFGEGTSILKVKIWL